jgi:putative integral membrane protein (TIGR02587 family)
MSALGEVREQGRGVVGALLVLGVALTYTTETWWLGLQVSTLHLVAYVVLGLALVVLVTRTVGFRDEDDDEAGHSPFWVEFTEVVFQSLFAGYGMLFLLGVVSLDDPTSLVVRTGLVHVVPLAFGASLANELLGGDQTEVSERAFPGNLAVFAIGAVFVGGPIAPTGEVGVLASRAGWLRVAAVLVVTLLVAYVMLYVLEFRGQSRRLEGRSRAWLIGQTCLVYAVAVLVGFALLMATNDLAKNPMSTWVQQTVVLAFPASVGAGGARVVIG